MSHGSSGGKQAIKSAITRNRGCVCLFLTTTFYLKDNNGKLWVDVIVVIFFIATGTVDVLTPSNNDVKLVETWTVYFANVKLPYRFERINKIDRDYSYRDILSLVCPWNTAWHFFYPINTRARAKIVGIVNKVYYFLLLTIIYLFSI